MAMSSLAANQYLTPTMTIVPASSVNRHVQPAYQQPQQQVVQTRVVQVTQTKTDDGNSVLRKFVNFKNLTERSRTRQSWEHCEHLDINLNPEELEQKVREHDAPGRDLITCFGNLGTFRQKHVRSYEHKLNARESDPGNWYWVLEALGEVRDHTTFTVNTFWAIFRRSPRNGNQQHPTRQIVVHNDPNQILTAGQQPGQTLVVSSPLAITGPVSSQLALPAPPSATTSAYPSSTAGSVYQVPQSTVQPAQYESTTTTQTTTYQPAATATPYGTGLLGATPTGTTSTTTVRQLTQAYGQRPSYPRQTLGSGYRTSEHDVLQYTGPESLSNRYQSRRQRWNDEDGDSVSDDSEAGSYHSGSSTSVNNYTSCGKPRRMTSKHYDRETRRSRPMESRSRNASLHRAQVSYPHHSSMPGGAEGRTYSTIIPNASRPLSHRQNTYDIDITLTGSPRPSLQRRATTSDRTPRVYTRSEDLEYEYDSTDDIYGRSSRPTAGRSMPAAPMPGSYGGERRYHA